MVTYLISGYGAFLFAAMGPLAAAILVTNVRDLNPQNDPCNTIERNANYTSMKGSSENKSDVGKYIS